jgi:hypothetical protein
LVLPTRAPASRSRAAYDDATGTDAVMSGFPVTTTYTLSNNYTRSMADGLAAAVR